MSILAWHFVGATLRDGRPVPADGETLVHDGPVVICKSGLHASRSLLDALQYAPGATLCRVRCGGVVTEDGDKLVCTERTILWRIDAVPVLRAFARRCALDAARLRDAPDVVRWYLETDDRPLRAAAWAAWDAARDAATGAATDAAWAAAWAAARAAQRKNLTRMVHAAHRAHVTEGT